MSGGVIGRSIIHMQLATLVEQFLLMYFVEGDLEKGLSAKMALGLARGVVGIGVVFDGHRVVFVWDLLETVRDFLRAAFSMFS